MKRLIDFAHREDLEIELVYSPPDHRKYNPVERCWGLLENHWNGSLLSSVKTTIAWAGTMTWRGIKPIVHLLEQTDERGVRLTKNAFEPYAAPLKRSSSLPTWSLTISPPGR